MSNDLVTKDENRPVPQGALAIAESSKVIEEIRSAIVMAKNFPRDEITAEKKIGIACSRFDFAEDAFYSYPRGGETIVGESVYLLREIARCWGNMNCGLREIESTEQYVIAEAFAHDYESNVRESITFKVEFKIKLKSGVIKFLTDPRDRYELFANYGARRLRAMMLHVIPEVVVKNAGAICRRTLGAGKKEVPFIDNVKTLVLSFSTDLGVSKDLIEERLKHSVENMNVEEFVTFRGIYKSIRDNVTKRDDWFALSKQEKSIGNVSTLNESLGITKKEES